MRPNRISALELSSRTQSVSHSGIVGRHDRLTDQPTNHQTDKEGSQVFYTSNNCEMRFNLSY